MLQYVGHLQVNDSKGYNDSVTFGHFSDSDNLKNKTIENRKKIMLHLTKTLQVNDSKGYRCNIGVSKV